MGVLKKSKGLAFSILLATVASGVGSAATSTQQDTPEEKRLENFKKILPRMQSTSSDVESLLKGGKTETKSTNLNGDANNLAASEMASGTKFLDLDVKENMSDKTGSGEKYTDETKKGSIKGGNNFVAKSGFTSSIWSAIKKKGLFGYTTNLLKKNKIHALGILSSLAVPFIRAFVYFRNEIRRTLPFDKEADVLGIAEDVVKMYATDPEHFADKVRCLEFYQLFSAYKACLSGLLKASNMGTAEFKHFLKILKRELLDRLSPGGPVEKFLRENLKGGIEMDVVVNDVLDYLVKLVNYDPRVSPQIPFLFCLGLGGTGKSKIAELIYELLTGVKGTVPLLNISGKDTKETSESISGFGPSYTGGDKLTRTLQLAKSPNTCFGVAVWEEAEKNAPSMGALGVFLNVITSKSVLRNYNNELTDIWFGIVANANFSNHQLASASSEIKRALFRGDRLDVIRQMKKEFVKDLENWGGNAVSSRTVTVLFTAPKRTFAYEIIGDHIKKPRKGVATFGVKFSDKVKNNRQFEYLVEKKIYEAIKDIIESPDVVGRSIQNNEVQVFRGFCARKYPNLNLGPNHILVIDWDEEKNDVDVKVEFKAFDE